jgi:hypothetical protein
VKESGQQTNDRVDHHHRGKLAPGEDVVSYRDLLRSGDLDEPLIDSLVSACYQDELPLGGQVPDHGLSQELASGREVQ